MGSDGEETGGGDRCTKLTRILSELMKQAILQQGRIQDFKEGGGGGAEVHVTTRGACAPSV